MLCIFIPLKDHVFLMEEFVINFVFIHVGVCMHAYLLCMWLLGDGGGRCPCMFTVIMENDMAFCLGLFIKETGSAK